MKEYRTNEDLIEYLSSKGVIIANKEARNLCEETILFT